MFANERLSKDKGLVPAFVAMRARLALVILLFALAGIGWWWTAGRMQGMDNGPWTSFSNCSSVARSSTNTPRRQFPSVITFGVSAIIATLRPPMSVPSTSPSRMLNTRVTRQKSYVAP